MWHCQIAKFCLIVATYYIHGLCGIKSKCKIVYNDSYILHTWTSRVHECKLLFIYNAVRMVCRKSTVCPAHAISTHYI